MNTPANVPAPRYQWFAAGDINAFFGLMLDNIANMVLLVALLVDQGIPAEFVLRHMIPGTAVGVLVGDLLYSWLAFRLARRTRRTDVTAMPLGLDTPGTFGIALFVLGPVFREAQQSGLDGQAAALFTWQVGICTLLASGLLKLACAPLAATMRRLFPRAGLLGSLTAVALVLISFIPLLDILQDPIVGLVALSIVLATLVARVSLPLHIPGALGALVVGCLMHFLLRGSTHGTPPPIEAVWLPTEWFASARGAWLPAWRVTLEYLPVAIPFALGAIIGGVDCSESAAAAGDDYHAGEIIAVEGLAALVAALCGGVIQTVPYIGHPAYKAMGGRTGYTLATAAFVGSAGLIGYFAVLYAWLPLAAVYPILIFIGLEITAQSFAATDRRHFPAVALACVPALAYLATMFVDPLLAASGKGLPDLPIHLAERLVTLRLLGGGFIITSLLWGSMLASLVDRRFGAAAVFLLIAAAATSCGAIHSTHPGTPLHWPWKAPGVVEFAPSALLLSGAYVAAALTLAAWDWWNWRMGIRPEPANDPGPVGHDAQPGQH